MKLPKDSRRERAKIITQIQAAGKVEGSNPISTLSHRADTSPVTTEKIVRQLEEEGVAQVSTSGDGRVERITYAYPRGKIDRTERSPQSRRERMFAKGVPAYLTNDFCSPVTSRFVDRPIVPKATNDTVFGHTYQQEKSDEVTPRETKYAKRSAVLTSYLQALRSKADSEGYAQGRSATSVLSETDPSKTQNQVAYAYRLLSDMGLLFAEGFGRQRQSYIVDMECVEVTPEMLSNYRAKQRGLIPKQDPQTGSEEAADSTPEQEEEPSSTPAPPEVNPLLRMADIIEQQEAVISELKNENTNLCNRLYELEAEITSLRSRVNTLDEKLSAAEATRDEHASEAQNLRQQMASQQEVDERIASILRRHQA